MRELIDRDREENTDDEYGEESQRVLFEKLEADFRSHQNQNNTQESQTEQGNETILTRNRSERSSLYEIFSTTDSNLLRCDLPASISWKQGKSHSSCNTFSIKNGWRHLEKWHPNLYDHIKNPNRVLPVSNLVRIYRADKSQLNTISKFFQTEHHSSLWAKFRWALFFILEHIPYSSAGDRFSHTYKLTGGDSQGVITPTTLSKVFLPALLAAVEEKMRLFFTQVNSVALTYDGWTDKQKQKFVIVTAHSVDKEWKVRRILLETIHLEESATIPILHSRIKGVMNQKLNPNIALSAITTDGASNMIASADSLCGDSLWCVCHRLNLVVTESISQDSIATQTIEMIRNYSKAVKSSTELTREFRNAQNASKPLSLSLDMITRWSSIYRMISKFVRLFETILSLSLNQSFLEISVLPPFSDCVQLRDILEPLADMTTRLQGEGNLALAYYLLEEYSSRPITGGKFSNLQNILKRRFEDRFNSDLTTPSLITRTSLLWPKKTGHVMSASLQRECWKKLIEDIEFLIPSDDNPEEEQQEDPDSLFQFLPSSSRQVNCSTAEETKSKMYRSLEELRKNWIQFGHTIDETPLLEFWSAPPLGLYHLQPLAKMMLAIPASSAASESVASVMGRIKTKTRSNLLPHSLIAEVTISLNRTLFDSEDDLIQRAIHFMQNPTGPEEPLGSSSDQSSSDLYSE